jgi:hypothetical protein
VEHRLEVVAPDTALASTLVFVTRHGLVQFEAPFALVGAQLLQERELSLRRVL